MVQGPNKIVLATKLYPMHFLVAAHATIVMISGPIDVHHEAREHSQHRQVHGQLRADARDPLQLNMDACLAD